MKTIEVENLSKRYFLGGYRANSIRDAIAGLFGGASGSKRKEFWALKDVSFDVSDGDRLGVIGHNGAGKSTLLKILSRITKPTLGHARIHGRVGSLLEVGTGFHNELTGRENIYLSGAILGMRHSEIDVKFDEIVAFSEIEEFLDTPVKHYSSGMYMRLAFSVAAHLEPEVLIVDEVLAVGDTSFQRKCLDKMEEIGRQGRTVLFVSHNLHAISRFCNRTIWIESGRIREDGDTQSVISKYLDTESHIGSIRAWDEVESAPQSQYVRLRRVRVSTEDGETAVNADIRLPLVLEVEYEILEAGRVLTPAFHIYNDQGICLFGTNDVDAKWRNIPREVGHFSSRAKIPGNFLAEGTFRVSVAVFGPLNNESHIMEDNVVSFSVFDSIEGDSARGDYSGNMIGVVRPLLEWNTSRVKADV